jgi:hypothetical protein
MNPEIEAATAKTEISDISSDPLRRSNMILRLC